MLFESVCVILLLVLLYKIFDPFEFWTKLGVPQMRPSLPIIQSLAGMMMSPCDGVRLLYQITAGHRFYGGYNMHRPVLFVRDPELVERVLITDFSHLYNRSIMADVETTEVSKQLVNYSDEKWKALRNKLSPTFTTGKIKGMHPQLVKCAESLVKYLSRYGADESIEFKDLSSRLSMDVIASVTFGLDLDLINNADSEFYRIGKKSFEPSYTMKIMFLLQAFLAKFYKLIGFSTVPKHMIKYFVNAIDQTLEYRKENNIRRPDFLQLMSELEKKDEERLKNGEIAPDDPGLFDHRSLLSNAFSFFTGGYETTSSAFSYLFYELALNQDMQDRIHEEIETVIAKHNGELTSESVGEMKLLDYALSESLRIHPPAAAVDRQVSKPYQIPGTDVVLPKGVTVSILIYGLHHDSQYFPEPERFNIDRFDPEKMTFPKGSYLPFGDGPRRCIAERFVRYEIKVCTAILLMNYKLMTGPKTETPLQYDPRSFMLTPKNGVWLKVQKRIASN